MRSKRKQVNAQCKTDRSAHFDSSLQTSKRTSGSKPFQISKARTNKRSSCDVDHRQPHQRNMTGSDELPERKEVYLDLIIKKKMIVDTKHHQILQSERKSLIYEELQADYQIYDKEVQNKEGLVKIKSIGCLNKNQQTPYCNQSLVHQKCKKIKSKCQFCRHMNCYLSQAVVERGQNISISKEQIQTEETEKNMKHRLKHEYDLRLLLKSVKEKAQNSPFAFTNIKWRTKSQIFQIDKWKKKYGKGQDSQKKTSSLSKMIKTKDEKIKSLINPSLQNTIRRSKMLSMIDKKLFPTIIKNPLPVIKISDEKVDEDYLETDLPFPVRTNKGSPRKEKIVMSGGLLPQTEDKYQILVSDENKIGGIPINSYYSTPTAIVNQNQEEKQKLYSQKLTIPDKKKQKEQTKKKQKKQSPKIVLVKGKNVGSEKINDFSKKENQLAVTQKISPHTWRQELPKKTFLDNIIQQIPERWQYGQSRGHSREVSQYIKIKEQEEEEKRRLQSELATFCEEQLLNSPRGHIIIQ